ncbi:acetylxylan esterase [Plantactinospora siamensis]|uniref:Acetylxylan esterase n=1 Tax=Plantactinospora siamensis TaxID=555372 RepID=A0ABV6P3D1_9ACTN
MLIDMSLEDLRAYRPDRVESGDFDEFWAKTLDAARSAAVPPQLTEVETGLIHVDTFDMTFSGYQGEPIKGWLRVPKHASGPLPVVLEYLGYGGGRGPAVEPTIWSSLGYAHMIMDSRGQSSYYGSADTPDGDVEPQVGGVMTRGIGAPGSYYYRRLYTDAAMAVDALRQLPAVDGQRVVVKGGSQGGGLAIAAAGLSSGLAGAIVDVPFLCGFRRATQISNEYPYREIADYLQYRRDRVAQVFTTLGYFDGVNLAARATAPTLFSTALMDSVCPPSTVFAAFNHWAGDDKRIQVYEYNGHDGGATYQLREQILFLTRVTGGPVTRGDQRAR